MKLKLNLKNSNFKEVFLFPIAYILFGYNDIS